VSWSHLNIAAHEGRISVVTRATEGLGFAAAKALADKGASALMATSCRRSRQSTTSSADCSGRKPSHAGTTRTTRCPSERSMITSPGFELRS
jgi:NAD(P)-dependent dehydrogenase (short-subunit alcohol dehydrogenase family)